jgi:hypothetical protein
MATTKKALALADDLASELKQRQSALAVTQSFDTDANPLVQVGAGTAGSKGGLIKIKPIDMPWSKDILGNQAEVFTPHVIQLGVEANPAGGAGADVNDRVTELLLLATLAARGTRVEVYESANGTAPTAATLVSANLKASFEANVQYPMVSSQ